MAIVWAAMLLTSIMVTLFTESLMNSGSEFVQILGSIPIFLFGAACVAMGVGMVFVIVIRFYKSLMGDEGYLMHTLPVKEWQLITSKGLSATIYTIACAVVVFISLIIFTKGDVISGLIGALPEFLERPEFILYTLEAVMVAIFGILKSVYQVYASLAIGQLVDRHRILLAAGAYCGIGAVIAVLTSIFTVIGINLDVNLVELFNPAEVAPFVAVQLLFIVVFLAELAQVVIFHVVTERLLTKKLNLV